MQELLIDELKDLYSAEKQIIRALPKIAKAASSPDQGIFALKKVLPAGMTFPV
jgi:ferritin-like metal-binding protein YciE